LEVVLHVLALSALSNVALCVGGVSTELLGYVGSAARLTANLTGSD